MAAFQIIRTYALYGRSWVVAVVLSLLNLPFWVISFVSSHEMNCIKLMLT